MPSPSTRPEAVRRAVPRGWIALLALLAGAVQLALLPPWMGEDEPWHYANIEHVARGHGGYPAGSSGEFTLDDQRFAPLSHLQTVRRFDGVDRAEAARVEREILESMRRQAFWRRVDWTGRDDTVESFDLIERSFSAAHQPPAYYFVAAPIVYAARHRPVEQRLLGVRVLSLALFVGTALAAYEIARRACGDERGALLAALLVALWPTSAHGAAVVSNDVLARALVALELLLALVWLRAERGGALLGAMVVVAALALLTKTTAASALAIVALALLLRPGGFARLRVTLLGLAVLGVVASIGVLAWIDAHNPAVPSGLQTAAQRLTLGLRPVNLRGLLDSFVGSFNWEGRPLPRALATLWGGVFGAGLAAGMASLLRAETTRRRELLLCAGALFAQFALVVLRGVGKGRYLMPAFPALAVLFAVGVVVWLPTVRARTTAVRVAVLLLVVFGGWYAWDGLARESWLAWRS